MKNIKTLLLSFLLVIISSIFLFGQERAIVGKILDGNTDLPLNNAQIKIKNSSVVTDSLGIFKIRASLGDTLKVFSVDHVDGLIIISSQSDLIIKLNHIQKTDDRVYSFVDESAEPKNGMRELFEQLGQHLVYPAEARRNAISGEVVLYIIIGREGEIQEMGIVKGIGFGCDEAALAALRASTVKWKPAIKDGKKVRSKLKLPLKFKI